MLSQASQKDPAMGVLGYARIEGDFYATPPENVACLAHYVDLSQVAVWEPACGEGHISKRLSGIAACVVSTDLYDRGYGQSGLDFLTADRLPPVLKMNGRRQGIITNPPFAKVAEQFIRKALELTAPVDGLVCMFLRNDYDTASTERDDLFEGHRAYRGKIIVTKRPRWIEGSKGSPRHSYAWYIWNWAGEPSVPTIRYIHPRTAAARASN